MKQFVYSVTPRSSIASAEIHFRNGIYNAPQMDLFFFCLLFLDPFLYISHVALVGTEGKKPYQEFLMAKYFYQAKANALFCF